MGSYNQDYLVEVPKIYGNQAEANVTVPQRLRNKDA
jgi:hypothetical protein